MKLSQQVRGLLDAFSGVPYELNMLPALKEGDMAGVRRFIRERKNHHRFPLDLVDAARDILSDPAGYKNSASSLKLLFNHKVKTHPIFSALAQQKDLPLETKLWIAYATNPSEDAAEGLGMIMAEYIKYRMSTDPEGYHLDVNMLIPQMDDELSDKIRKDVFSSIKAVQHQLVEYVARDGKALPLNRGAGFLSAAQDLPGADLWTKKIEDFSVRTRESMTKGTIRHYSPVYPS